MRKKRKQVRDLVTIHVKHHTKQVRDELHDYSESGQKVIFARGGFMIVSVPAGTYYAGKNQYRKHRPRAYALLGVVERKQGAAETTYTVNMLRRLSVGRGFCALDANAIGALRYVLDRKLRRK